MSSRVDRIVWAKAPFLFLNNGWIKQFDRKPKPRKPNDATTASLFDQSFYVPFTQIIGTMKNTWINTVSETLRMTNLSDRWVTNYCIDGSAANMRPETKSEKEEIMSRCSKNWIWGPTTTK